MNLKNLDLENRHIGRIVLLIVLGLYCSWKESKKERKAGLLNSFLFYSDK